MDEHSAAITAKALSSPAAKALIEKISNGVGRLYDPIHARRMNKVESKNRIEEAKTDQEVARITAEGRHVNEQINIDEIAQMAASMLSVQAKPDEIHQDWLNRARDMMKCVEDRDMQGLWAKIVAGEADSPGRFSYRVLEEVSRLSKEKANAFTKLAGYVWCWTYADGEVKPILVIDTSNPLVRDPNGTLIQTSLIRYFANGVQRFSNCQGKVVHLQYFGSRCQLKILTDDGFALNTEDDNFVLSDIGEALFPICGGSPIPGEFETMVEKWSQRDGLAVVSTVATGSS